MSSTSNPLKNSISTFQLEEAIVGTQIAKTLSLPQTATGTLFTITGGAILVVSLVGLVTTATGATATNLSLGLTPTVGTANNVGIGGPSAITSLVAGTAIAAPATAGSGGSSLVAPAVPASTVAAVNNYHGTVDVTITGGTLTQVFVNGQLVGTTAGTYPVPAHGSISITYTVAPTWTWAGSVALEISTAGTLGVPKDVGFIAPAGAITWTTSASDTGSIRWYLDYIPLDWSVIKGVKVV